MAFTLDYQTDRGKVRLLATDVDPTEALFDDAQIDVFLALEGGVKTAAALALETIASSEALVQKKTRLLDLSTDGPAVAKELRERAAALRTQAGDADTTGAFDWAELVLNGASADERLLAQALRGEV